MDYGEIGYWFRLNGPLSWRDLMLTKNGIDIYKMMIHVHGTCNISNWICSSIQLTPILSKISMFYSSMLCTGIFYLVFMMGQVATLSNCRGVLYLVKTCSYLVIIIFLLVRAYACAKSSTSFCSWVKDQFNSSLYCPMMASMLRSVASKC